MASEPAVASGACRGAGVRRRSGRVARLLACALLEWILIALLLANGVFSYLIARFAAFFGLPPPCALCTRLAADSLFDRAPRHGAEPLCRVLCDGHAAEVSRLGYCRAHHRLADAADMCEDCGAPAPSGKALLSWMRRSELGERDLACACCGVALESGFYSPPFLLPTPPPAARDLDQDGHGDVVFVSEDGPVIELFDEKPLVEDDSIAVISAHRAGIAVSVERPVPLESIDSLADGVPELSSEPSGERKGAVDHVTVEQDYADEEKFVVASDVQHSPRMNDGLKDMSLSEDEEVEQGTVEHELFSMPSDAMEHGFVVDKSDGNTEEVPVQHAGIKDECDAAPVDGGPHDSEALNENTEENQVQRAELSRELDSVMIHPREHVDEECGEDKISLAELKQELESVALDSWEQVTEISTENTENHVEQPELMHLSASMAAGVLESPGVNATTGQDDIEVDPTESLLPSLHQLSDGHSISSDKSSPDCSDVEDKRVSDTPTHIEGISYLQELPDPEAATTDTKSVDSSVGNMFTDLESVELVTVDQLKSALGAAHKSLSTLCAELENERSAAAIAADETMAMINRLQEQKAAMQMEAMQYQRLMEEQSEYDQEALQRLNDLVVKRDKERQDMERELELYRHKIHLYEAKERRKMSRHKADDQNGSSSASSSAEDSDDLSQSFYEGDESAHGLNGSNGSSPTDVVLHETASHIVTLDGSLADCEEERLSILEQLKVLEERLFDLEDEESDNLKMDKHFTEDNGASNGFSDEDISFKLHDSRKGVSHGGKKLLPLFDDATTRNGNGLLTKQDTEADPSAEVVLELAKEQDKIAIASEIDQVHERLQALEADKEFIKQCVRSLNKGGKGFVLLQEILQHLRDLRRIEQRARNNSGEVSPHCVHPYTD
uniref:Predicted protein n=1 Tax=Hordeum vulgare subsp. vulgare TaxID=112509 RepID=F2DVV9_HORVV|nr:predicted protein [Hordeum vulgare subsp. vulgare]